MKWDDVFAVVLVVFLCAGIAALVLHNDHEVWRGVEKLKQQHHMAERR